MAADVIDGRFARSPVPVIDVGPFRDGSPAERRAVAEEVGRACEDIGFLVITGHGVPQSSIDAVYAASAAFYDLDPVEKLEVVSPHGDPFHAYAPVESQYAGQVGPPDLREMYHSNRYDTPEEAIAAGYPTEVVVTMPPNLWPRRPEGFETAWKDYYDRMVELCDSLLSIFAVALDLEPGWFADKVDHHLSNLCANHYPAQLTPPLPGQVRGTAHVDFATLTVLYQDDAPGGLQVYRRGDGWLDIPSIPDSYVVNLGDMMARWTNDRWVATPHRVVNPPAEGAARRRISIPFFHNPNHDALIETIPSCVTPERPAKYEPITAGDWIEARRRGQSASAGRVSA